LPKVRDYAERALAADPQSPDAHFALGSYHSSLYLSEGKGTIDEVIGVYREAVALRPNFPQAQVALANMLRVKGELEEAIGIFENVLEHDPGHRDANENYISTMIDIGRFEEAAAALNRWMAVRPDPTQKQLYEAYSLLEQGKSAEALKMAEKIDVADDQNRRYRDFTIRYARYDLGDLDWVRKNALRRMNELWLGLDRLNRRLDVRCRAEVSSAPPASAVIGGNVVDATPRLAALALPTVAPVADGARAVRAAGLQERLTFDSVVEGQGNGPGPQRGPHMLQTAVSSGIRRQQGRHRIAGLGIAVLDRPRIRGRHPVG